MEDTNIKVKSLYKALKLLDCFSEQNTLLGISEVSEKAALPKSTVHNIFSTFAVCGILVQDSKTGKYHLGPKIVQLSNSYFASSTSMKAVSSEMEKLSSIFNENVYYGTLFEDQVLYLEAVHGSTLSRSTSIIGATAPLHCTGIGKCILAWLSDPALIDRLCKKGLRKFTDNTITSRTLLEKELAEIREQGYAVDNMEHEYGVKCVAVPIFRSNGVLSGAISISCPSLRVEGKELAFAQTLYRAQQTLKSFIF